MPKPNDIRVARFDPEVDAAPRYDRYEVPIEEGWSILNVLAYIYEQLDPTLCFYGPCRVGKCVACHVKVNGKTRLACTELAPQQDMTFDPMTRRGLIRDLVIDRSQVHEAVE
jgi:succinate dehydrogenase/fumarate reductase iron-sulfur protein